MKENSLEQYNKKRSDKLIEQKHNIQLKIVENIQKGMPIGFLKAVQQDIENELNEILAD